MLGGLTTLLIFYKWTESRWGEKTAILSSLLMMSSTVFMMGSVIALPDSLAIPLALIAMIYANKCDSRKVGFFLGLALLGKWTVLFITPGLLYSFYKQKKLTAINLLNLILIPLLLQAPVILWNIQNGGVSLKFHLYSRHQHEVLNLMNYVKNTLQFFSAQLFSLGIFLVSLIIFLWIYLLRNKSKLKVRHDIDWLSHIFWTAPGLAIVFISAFQGEIRFYWTYLSLIPIIATVGYLLTLYFDQHYRLITVSTIIVICAQWTIAFFVGFCPVGQTIETAFNLKPDLRHSPMGEFNGWKKWFNEVIIAESLVDENTALIGSDLHVASRLSWTIRKNVHLSSVGAVGNNKNQFHFWPHPSPPRYTKAIFFADNRYNRISNFDGQCNHSLDWKTTSVEIYGRIIKDIYWSHCKSLNP